MESEDIMNIHNSRCDCRVSARSTNPKLNVTENILQNTSKKVNKTELSEIINVYNSPRRQKTVKKLLTEKNNNNCRMIP